jgi:tRNA(Arg) A34 adenosine deaminase TadA
MQFAEVSSVSESLRDPEFIECLSGFISPDKGQVVSKFLNQSLPYPELLHLKRLRKVNSQLQVLICPLDQASSIDFTILDQWIDHESREIVNVVKLVPVNQLEFKQWTGFWPIGYTPPPPPPELSDRDKGIIERIVKSRFIQRNKDEMKAVVFTCLSESVIADEMQIIAEARDQRNLHFLKHACVCAIDLACEKIQRKKLELASGGEEKEKELNLKRKVSHDSEPLYFCTGLDLICDREPCSYCAMAILHSRFSRVFYFEPNEKAGGLGSVYNFHANPKFNHKFRVFRVNLKLD